MEIFVFGSNEKGIHGAGAALYAKRHYGAVYGEGVGRTGNAYAIPTKHTPYQSLTIDIIGDYINDFIKYACEHPELTFIVTRVGCGLAGFKDEEIAPWFMAVPDNVLLPIEWKDHMLFKCNYHTRSADPKHEKVVREKPNDNPLF